MFCAMTEMTMGWSWKRLFDTHEDGAIGSGIWCCSTTRQEVRYETGRSHLCEVH